MSVNSGKTSSNRFQVGDTVIHDTFGFGQITNITPIAGDYLLKIQFETAGSKALMSRIAASHLKPTDKGPASVPKGFSVVNQRLIQYTGPGGDVTIPEGVISIGDKAFSNCINLTGVTIPDSVTSVGDFAFSGCINLTSILIQGADTCFGEWTFYGCKNIKYIKIPDKLKSLGKDPFGYEFPKGLLTEIDSILQSILKGMTDSALKTSLLLPELWDELTMETKIEIYFLRQSKTLQDAYWTCIDEQAAEQIGQRLLEQLTGNASARECNIAAAFMTSFYEMVSTDKLRGLYEHLKTEKHGVKAFKSLEEKAVIKVILSSMDGNAAELPPIMQKVNSLLSAKHLFLKDLEKNLNDFFALSITELPNLKTTDGEEANAYVSAWLLTAHERLKFFSYGQPDVVSDYERPGLCPEAEEIISFIDPVSLQAMLMLLADKYLDANQNTKKKFLVYPFCRYADEKSMAELSKRSYHWATALSGNNSASLLRLRDAVIYNNTRSAMLFAEKMGDLDKYAALRGMTEDELRDKYLSDVGLNEQGGKAYDLGNQTVTARLQKDLGFLFELPGGKTAKSLPKKNADPAKYETAKADFDELRKSVKKILKSRGNVLFEDFLSGRERKSDAWQEAYLKNPLLRMVASLLVWEQGGKTFTLSEADPIDSAGQGYAITDKPIRVAHPMEMEAEDLKAWQKYFTSNGLKQPFAQVWEPMIDPATVTEDRYTGCYIPYYRFTGQAKHGITVEDYDFHNEIIISFSGCTAAVERIDWNRHYIDQNHRFEIKTLTFDKYTRQINHLLAYLDRVTVWDRVRKDDESVMAFMDAFTLAQITEFIQAAQDASAVNVLALLLDYKNAHFPDFDPMDEFTLEW